VDEGPGLSGSSFAAVAEALTSIGFPVDRVVLFPSWLPQAASLRSERARRVWDTHPKAMASFESVWIDSGRLLRSAAARDISAGRWRELAYGDEREWPAVQPQHERRKYLTGDRALHKFAGLGRHGRGKRDRAAWLSDQGVGPRVSSLANGFIERPWVEGVPVDRVDRDLLHAIADYVALLRTGCALGEPDDTRDLVDLMTANLGEAFGADGALAAHRAAAAAERWEEPRVAVDGRMLPHEWLRTARGLIKVDALDHHADDFVPGCRDAAWDLAGAIVEFDLDDAARVELVSRYCERSRDRTIASRLEFYTLAYFAWRIGYVTLAVQTLGDGPDGVRFRRAAEWYRRSRAGRAVAARAAAR
jgi:hypothetical protein